MKKLKIKNFGPIAEADIDLGRVNLIIGTQSSGKSCILKTACFCSWVEKRIELTQSAEEYGKESFFIANLCGYHKMKDYVCPNTYIEYESPYMKFSYDHATMTFTFKWKRSRWNFLRPKISYVPSGRNLLAAIPIWSKLPLENDNLLDFMNDWNTARNKMLQLDNVLGLGLSYRYDQKSNTDTIVLQKDKSISLAEGSSGMQSLLPLFVHLTYLFDPKSRNQNDSKQSYEQKEEQKRLIKLLAKHRQVNGYLLTDHNEMFLEEPEDNLFPPTQCQLVDWLLAKMSENSMKDILFVATHSPYVLNQFIKDKAEGFRLFITYPDAHSGKFKVKSLSENDIQDVYGNGVDLFFNFESYL